MYIYNLKNLKHLVVRMAKIEDAEEIIELSNRVGGETDNLSYSEGEYYMTKDAQENFIDKMLISKNSCFLVGIVDGKIVATLSFLSSSRKRMEHRGEMGVAVLKDFWGLGIAKSMISFFLKWARGNGITRKIDLLVREDNLSAIGLYLKFGFEIEGKVSRGMFTSGKYYNIYQMGKSI